MRGHGGDIDGILGAIGDELTDPLERDYFEYNMVRNRFTLREITRFAQNERLRILDVGCYPFHLAAALESLGHDVYGICSEHEVMHRPNIACLNLETDEFPWPDGFFDVVLFTEVLEHLPQSPVPALREMRRVTTRSGHLLLTTPNLASARQRLLLLRGRTVMYPIDVYFERGGLGSLAYHRHNREYTASELAVLLSRTGWTVEELHDFMAYPTLFRDKPGRSSFDREVLGRLKYLAHLVMPNAKDTLYALARPASGTSPSEWQ